MSNEQINIRPVKNSDKLIIISEASTIFNLDIKQLSLIWDWLFIDNPYIKGNYSDGWVMEKNNKIIGSISIFPQLFNINGEEKILKFGSYFFISKEYRQPLNTFNFLNRFIKSNNDYLFVGNTPINGIKNLFKPFGSFILNNYTNENYYYLIRSDIVLIEWSNDKNNSNIIRAIIKIFSPFIKIIDYLRIHVLSKKKLYQFTKCIQINDEFNLLWEGFKDSYDILAVRNKQYLRWRYLNHPLKNNRLISIKRDGLLVGYLAYSIRKRKNSGLMIFEVLDIFCDHTDVQLVQSILRWIIQKAKKTKTDLIKISFLPNKLRKLLLKNGFIKSSKPNIDFIIFKNNSGHSDDYIKNGENWCLSSSDGDYILGI